MPNLCRALGNKNVENYNFSDLLATLVVFASNDRKRYKLSNVDPVREPEGVFGRIAGDGIVTKDEFIKQMGIPEPIWNEFVGSSGVAEFDKKGFIQYGRSYCKDLPHYLTSYGYDSLLINYVSHVTGEDNVLRLIWGASNAVARMGGPFTSVTYDWFITRDEFVKELELSETLWDQLTTQDQMTRRDFIIGLNRYLNPEADAPENERSE